MQQSCQTCNKKFSLLTGEKKLLEQLQIPLPLKCFSCRLQQRLSFRNEHKFYKRDCDSCHKTIISLYSKEKPWIVYCSNCWWSDSYDPLTYGQAYDPSLPFFTQLKSLISKVPKPAIMNMHSENSTYTNYSHNNQNCYMVVGTGSSQDCYYSYRIFDCRDVVDCFDLQKSELCYECTQSRNLYNCRSCNSCDNSANLTLCNDCIGCHNCFACTNLRNKQFYIFNQAYSEHEYQQKIQELQQNWQKTLTQYQALKLNSPHRAYHLINCKNSSGQQLSNTKNCHYSFALHDSESCQYMLCGTKNKFCCDTNFTDHSELLYNSTSCEDNYQVIAANLVWYTKNSSYVTNCFNSQNLFGCIGMKKNQYCILNKQYSKDEYQQLTNHIIATMHTDNSWGSYYPAELSPFAYNETIAQEYFPLTQDQATQLGYQWKSEISKPKTRNNDVILCEVTNEAFKIFPAEYEFYQKMRIPLPTKCPQQRHKERMATKIYKELWTSTCKCSARLQTTYKPDSPEQIYCQNCYFDLI